MYQYEYIHCKVTGGLFGDPGAYRTVIDQMAAEDWRFVSFIPNDSNINGMILGGDLVFEKPVG